jgi:coenzyme F420-reducing hydrogenase alpha subunit
VQGRGAYLCGPLARFALGYERLSPLAREAAHEAGVGPEERNPFRSIVVRTVELVYAADEALRLIADYEEPDAPAIEATPRPGVGHGCTEAPRGILYHRYRIDEDGTILDAKIVPPTSQNQRTIEEDLRGVVERSLDVPDDELTLLCEQTIRNYDPCISCATHFLKLEIERR